MNKYFRQFVTSCPFCFSVINLGSTNCTKCFAHKCLAAECEFAWTNQPKFCSRNHKYICEITKTDGKKCSNPATHLKKITELEYEQERKLEYEQERKLEYEQERKLEHRQECKINICHECFRKNSCDNGCLNIVANGTKYCKQCLQLYELEIEINSRNETLVRSEYYGKNSNFTSLHTICNDDLFDQCENKWSKRLFKKLLIYLICSGCQIYGDTVNEILNITSTKKIPNIICAVTHNLEMILKLLSVDPNTTICDANSDTLVLKICDNSDNSGFTNIIVLKLILISQNNFIKKFVIENTNPVMRFDYYRVNNKEITSFFLKDGNVYGKVLSTQKWDFDDINVNKFLMDLDCKIHFSTLEYYYMNMVGSL